MFHVKHYDVVVIGGGHAGAEAAAAAARRGAQVALITLRRAGIGVMSCNPAIGGLGKGHLVREIDALDGLMAKAGDAAGIQFRLLNRRKGPAVQGPRAQADRKIYRKAVLRLLEACPGVAITEGEVVDLTVDRGEVTGVVLADGTVIGAAAVVLTAGTFLNGVMHIGDQRQAGGRVGDAASVRLGARLADLDLGRGRLKTGTPPRLDGRTIDWARLDMQPGDDQPVMFSFLNHSPVARQISCGITETNEATHDIVRGNLHRSAMYGGQIEGVGPRYCPSIEDKVVRFSEKTGHQVFLEPEGLDNPTVYPNGISTSLPADVQEAYVRTIAGLEAVAITQPGYAIEYDFFDPRGLTMDLQVRNLPGLYFAGQINGTTGYEEAAAQGLVAGANAAGQALDLPPLVLSRSNSYIGVMMDDLTSRGVTEPYRMFTSRAEFRLSLRADNADQRLTPMGIEAGLVSQDRAETFEEKQLGLNKIRANLQEHIVGPAALRSISVPVSEDGVRRTAFDVLSFPDVTIERLLPLVPELADADPRLCAQVAIEALYAPYLDRQASEIAVLRRGEETAISPSFDYEAIAGLSNELRAKLIRQRPETLERAGRMEGMTPAALMLILAHVRKSQKHRAAS